MDNCHSTAVTFLNATIFHCNYAVVYVFISGFMFFSVRFRTKNKFRLQQEITMHIVQLKTIPCILFHFILFLKKNKNIPFIGNERNGVRLIMECLSRISDQLTTLFPYFWIGFDKTLLHFNMRCAPCTFIPLSSMMNINRYDHFGAAFQSLESHWNRNDSQSSTHGKRKQKWYFKWRKTFLRIQMNWMKRGFL